MQYKVPVFSKKFVFNRTSEDSIRLEMICPPPQMRVEPFFIFCRKIINFIWL